MNRVGLKAPGSAMIVFDDVHKHYDESGSAVGMDGVALRIDKGEFVFLVGPSGSGKSTFIRLLLKEVEPDAGKVMVGGRTLSTLKRSKVPQLRRNIGCVFQDYKLLPNRTVFENVAYAMQVTGHSRSEIRRRVPEIVQLVGLAQKIDSYPDELSGGEQQRVSIARAFVNKPPLLIADEPTGNLDPETSIGIMELLNRINKTGTTVVVATHDVVIVDKMRRRVIQLEKGRVVRDQVRAQYGDSIAEEIGLNDLRGQTGTMPAIGSAGPYATGPLPAVQSPTPADPVPPAYPPSTDIAGYPTVPDYGAEGTLAPPYATAGDVAPAGNDYAPAGNDYVPGAYDAAGAHDSFPAAPESYLPPVDEYTHYPAPGQTPEETR